MVMSTTPSVFTARNLVELMPAAGAAARSGRVFRCSALVHLERVPASTGRRHVRVVDREAALQALDEVDLGSLEIRRAERVDRDRNAVGLDLEVALLGTRVEAEGVFKARAASALHGDAKHTGLALGLLGHQVRDLP